MGGRCADIPPNTVRGCSNYDNDILIEFDAQKLTADNFQVIVNLSEMLKDSGEVGKMEYDIYKFDIKSMKTYERDLINVV